jgi:hypothetical protein
MELKPCPRTKTIRKPNPINSMARIFMELPYLSESRMVPSTVLAAAFTAAIPSDTFVLKVGISASAMATRNTKDIKKIPLFPFSRVVAFSFRLDINYSPLQFFEIAAHICHNSFDASQST